MRVVNLVALTVFAVGEGFTSVLENADGKTVSATRRKFES
jgi:hypothetical protein